MYKRGLVQEWLGVSYMYVTFSVGTIWYIIFFLSLCVPYLVLYEWLSPKFYWPGPWLKLSSFKIGPGNWDLEQMFTPSEW